MQNVIEAAHAALTEILAHIEQYSDLTNHITAAEQQIAALRAHHADITAKLKDDQGLLDQRQRDAVVQHNKLIFEKQQEIKQLTAQISVAQSNLSGLQSAVRQAKAEHESIQGQMDAIRKRFA